MKFYFHVYNSTDNITFKLVHSYVYNARAIPEKLIFNYPLDTTNEHIDNLCEIKTVDKVYCESSNEFIDIENFVL